MAKRFLKVLPELVEAELLTAAQGESIRKYFDNKHDKSQSRLMIVFGILGSLLTGLGIILILAHNWDNFSTVVKSVLAFFPLVVAQGIAVFVIIRKFESIVWREGAAVFLFFAVGVSISLISQIYQIPGNLSSFLLTWMLLCLPVIYLLKSTSMAFLIIAGITYYACETSYWTRHHEWSWGYWVTMLLIIPHYYQRYKQNSQSNFFIVLNWLFLLSITVSLGTLADQQEEFMYVAYLSWFGICINTGLRFETAKNVLTNAFTVIGWSGSIVLLLILSFEWFWVDLIEHQFEFWSVEFCAAGIITLLGLALLLNKWRSDSAKSIQFIELVFILLPFLFFVGVYTTRVPIIGINLLILSLGLLKVLQGGRDEHLGTLNFGLLIISMLVLLRFFDADISFVLRGVLFVALGLGFFVSNFVLLKKRKKNET